MLQIPAGAKFQLAQLSDLSGENNRRRLLQQLPQPEIVSASQVSVTLDNVGGYYYLTGGTAPIINATSSELPQAQCNPASLNVESHNHDLIEFLSLMM